MKRIQLFEFEDFKWFPNWIRTCLTNLIVVLNKILGISDVLANLIAPILKQNGIKNIIDLGSGSGGVMPDVLHILHEKKGFSKLKLTLTDLYPSLVTIKKINDQNNESIHYFTKSVDATNIISAPEGLKTMVNCFHHMKPKDARKILKSAQESKQPLLVYEMAENNLPLVLWWILLPVSLIILIVMSLIMTPFVKPLTARQLIFTYLIPIIPIFYAWDGQASMPRLYTQQDLNELLKGIQNTDYKWKNGIARKKNGKKLGTFLIGLPN